MQKFIDQQAFLETHSTDPDTRKGGDPTEGPKHFLDIDYYPDYKNLTHNLDSLIAKYGTTIVINDNGILPWATVWAMDSLTAQLKRGDWTKAYQTAADIGHYVADGHQPLHVAQNYDGVMTSQKGIHSRYETSMMNANISSIAVAKDSVHYIADPMHYIFNYLLISNQDVDSLLAADKYAAPPAGYNGTGTLPANYYSLLWEKTNGFTKRQIQSATIDLASLWYTAWVNAGLLAKPTQVGKSKSSLPEEFRLEQNYPNPFNPKTQFQFSLASQRYISFQIFDLQGKEITTLVNQEMNSGNYNTDMGCE